MKEYASWGRTYEKGERNEEREKSHGGESKSPGAFDERKGSDIRAI